MGLIISISFCIIVLFVLKKTKKIFTWHLFLIKRTVTMKIVITIENGTISAERGIIVKQHELLAVLLDFVVEATRVAVVLQALAIVQRGAFALRRLLVYLYHHRGYVGLLFDNLYQLINRLVNAYHYVLDMAVVLLVVRKCHQPQIELNISINCKLIFNL